MISEEKEQKPCGIYLKSLVGSGIISNTTT